MGIRANFGGYDFEVRVNDTYPTFSTVLKDGESDNDSNAIDISAPTTFVELYVKKPDNTTYKVKAGKTGEDGEIYYQWKNGDIDLVGTYEIEPKITFDGGKIYTSLERTRFKVVERITGA